MARISSEASSQVQLCQIPNSFSRYAGFAPNFFALRASNAGIEVSASDAA